MRVDTESLQIFRTKIGRVFPKEPDIKELDDLKNTHNYASKDRKSLLDDLDYYFSVRTYLERKSKGALGVFDKVGCRIICEEGLITPRLEMFKDKKLPGMGAALLGYHRGGRDKSDILKFISFEKLTMSPIGIELAFGSIYRITMVYLDEDAGKRDFLAHGVSTEFCVVLENGRARLLREMVNNAGYPNNNRHARWIPSKALWRYPMIKQKSEESVHDAASATLALALSLAVAPSGGVQVRASKNGSTALFAMSSNDAKKMFPARQRVGDLASDGKRKRIWHWNKGWIDKNGRSVAWHFKGDRDFEWNGYSLHIRHDSSDAAELATGLSGIDMGREWDDLTADEQARYLSPAQFGGMVEHVATHKDIRRINRDLKEGCE